MGVFYFDFHKSCFTLTCMHKQTGLQLKTINIYLYSTNVYRIFDVKQKIEETKKVAISWGTLPAISGKKIAIRWWKYSRRRWNEAENKPKSKYIDLFTQIKWNMALCVVHISIYIRKWWEIKISIQFSWENIKLRGKTKIYRNLDSIWVLWTMSCISFIF
jgi:hypothetical protein